MKNTHKDENKHVYQLFCKKEDLNIEVFTSSSPHLIGISDSLNVVMQILDSDISFYVRTY